MIGGTYLVATGTVPLWVLVFSIPYALLVTRVLFGKHIDKIVPDTALGIRTVPVILGEYRARRVSQVLMIAVLPAHRAGRAGRLGRAVGAARRCSPSRRCARAAGLQPAQAGRATRVVSRRAAGRCGSSASPSATCGWPAAC